MTAVVDAPTTTLPYAVAATWGLVRECTGRLPVPGPGQQPYRAAVDAVTAALADMEALRGTVEDELHELVGHGGGDRRVLLPIRRAVHNARPLTEALAAAADTLGLDSLTAWRAAQRRADAAVAAVTAYRLSALRDARTALADAAGADPVVRAAAGTSPLLAQAVTRYAARAGEVDRRSAKSEPTVLRHVLRAATKTVPLGWFVRVDWSDAATGTTTTAAATPERSVVRASLAGLRAVAWQVGLERPEVAHPVRLAPDLVLDDDAVSFTRRRGDGSESVRLRRSGAVEAVLAAFAGGRHTLERAGLRRVLSERLVAGGDAVAALERAGLLQPAEPVSELVAADPRRLADWCAQVGRSDVAAGLRELDELLQAYAVADLSERGVLGGRLEATWARLPGAEGHGSVVTEDVVGAASAHPEVDRRTLERLTPVCEAFDWFTLVRRVAAIEWERRLGEAAPGLSLAAYAELYDRLWSDPRLLEPAHIAADPVVGAVLNCRAAIREAATTTRTTAGLLDTDLGDAALDVAAEGLPAQLAGRPYSIAFFVQAERAGQVVNDVYGGWGRFTSRFLELLPTSARADVWRGIGAGLGEQAQAAQIRPVAGFAANLHPLLAPVEISDDPGRGECVAVSELVAVLSGGEVRLRRRGCSQDLDVLYLGSLVPLLLPRRLRPLVNDLGSGLVDLSTLRTPVQLESPIGRCRAWGRLTAGRTVLARRRWELDAAAVTAWAALLADPAVPTELTVARVRVALGWPSGVFIGAGARGTAGAAEASGGGAAPGLPGTSTFTERMGHERSQFVDLLDPLALTHLTRLLARFPHGICVEEALPLPQAGQPAREVVVETYRKADAPCMPW